MKRASLSVTKAIFIVCFCCCFFFSIFGCFFCLCVSKNRSDERENLRLGLGLSRVLNYWNFCVFFFCFFLLSSQLILRVVVAFSCLFPSALHISAPRSSCSPSVPHFQPPGDDEFLERSLEIWNTSQRPCSNILLQLNYVSRHPV